MRQLWQLLPSPSQGPRQAGSENILVLGGCLVGDISSGQSLKDKRHSKKGGIQGPILLCPAWHLPCLLAFTDYPTHSPSLALLFTWRERDSPDSYLTLIPPATEETLVSP